MRYKTILLLTSTLLFSPVSVFCVETPEEISLSVAMDIALANNHDHQVAVKNREIAREQLNQVWGNLNPIIETEASMSRQGAEHGFLSLSDGQYDIKIAQLKFGINPGVFYNSLQASRGGYKVATEEVRKVKSEIRISVIKGYFSLLLARELVALTKESIELSNRNLRDVQNHYRTGSVPKYDLLRAQVQVKSLEPELIEAKNRALLALEQYNYHLGVSGKKYTASKDELELEKLKKISEDLFESSMRLTELALQNRPELIQLELARKIAHHRKDIYSSVYYWPTFTIGGYYGYSKNLVSYTNPVIYSPVGPLIPDLSRITGKRGWQQNWTVRIGATYRWSSLLPWDSNRAREREEKIKMNKADIELIKFKRLIDISIISSLSNLVTAYKSILSHRENVETAEEGLRIARESYRAGVIKNSELLAAQFSLTKAKTGYINSVAQYHISFAELKKSVGIDNETTLLGGDK